jgi:hypothetical protein
MAEMMDIRCICTGMCFRSQQSMAIDLMGAMRDTVLVPPNARLQKQMRKHSLQSFGSLESRSGNTEEQARQCRRLGGVEGPPDKRLAGNTGGIPNGPKSSH